MKINNTQGSMVTWRGGKLRLIQFLKKDLPKFEDYWDPFCGSCALPLSIQPKSGVFLSDTCGPLINAFVTARDMPLVLADRLSVMDAFRDNWYELRNGYTIGEDTLYDATMFFYLNSCCFNSLWRVNKKNKFNVPWRRNGIPNAVLKIKRQSKIIKKWKFYCRDFAETLPHEGDLVFVDPPYKGTQQYSGEFKRYLELVELCNKWRDRGVNVIFTHIKSEYVDQLFDKDWSREQILVSHFRANTPRWEIIYRNWK